MKTNEEQHFFEQVWSFWTPPGAEAPPCLRYLICGNTAVTLHEIDPKSTNPEWLDQPFNSIPICESCHAQVQLAPTVSAIELREMASQRAQNVRDWKGADFDGVIKELHEDKQERKHNKKKRESEERILEKKEKALDRLARRIG